jgi:hypothetical protein
MLIVNFSTLVVKIKFFKKTLEISCHNPTLRECEDETHTPEIGTQRIPKISEFDCRGQIPCIRVFFISLESYRSVNVENGLAWAIWTSTAQVMAKRRVRN